ncbi:hypothetical protein N9980_01210 [bacterium]|nr:hypothetical protein [bacterium]
MAIGFLLAFAAFYLVALLIIASLQLLMKNEEKDGDVSNIDLGCMSLYTPVYLVVVFYGFAWFKTGEWNGVSLEEAIRYLGLADTILKETSWQGFQKLNDALLAVDIVWYLLLVSFIGSWMICFSDWFEKDFAPVVISLRKKIRG